MAFVSFGEKDKTIASVKMVFADHRSMISSPGPSMIATRLTAACAVLVLSTLPRSTAQDSGNDETVGPEGEHAEGKHQQSGIKFERGFHSFVKQL